MMGRIHSVESMGLLDGPGIRFVVFMQGCKLRCAYCHNPDTWYTKGGLEVSSDDLLRKIARYIPYFKKSNGGVTFSGGEPLLQPGFLIEMLRACRNMGISTAIDTAGVGQGQYKQILDLCDLVILDLKHVTSEGYQWLTGDTIENLYPFLQALKKSSTKVWIRHVIVPGITDSPEHLKLFKTSISKFVCPDKVELLPYHTLGEHKYEKLGLKYRLAGIKTMHEIKE